MSKKELGTMGIDQVAKSRLQDRIGRGEVETVIQDLLQLEGDSKFRQEALAISSRFHRLQHQRLKGILTTQEDQVVSNQISSSLLDLVQSIPEEPSEEDATPIGPTTSWILKFLRSIGLVQFGYTVGIVSGSKIKTAIFWMLGVALILLTIWWLPRNTGSSFGNGKMLPLKDDETLQGDTACYVIVESEQPHLLGLPIVRTEAPSNPVDSHLGTEAGPRRDTTNLEEAKVQEEIQYKWIQGTISEQWQSGKVVIGARIEVFRDGKLLPALSVDSDAEGKFELKIPSTSTMKGYTLRITHPDYQEFASYPLTERTQALIIALRRKDERP